MLPMAEVCAGIPPLRGVGMDAAADMDDIWSIGFMAPYAIKAPSGEMATCDECVAGTVSPGAKSMLKRAERCAEAVSRFQ